MTGNGKHIYHQAKNADERGMVYDCFFEHWLKMAILHFVRTDWPLGELRNFIGCMPV
jgi:hypothetical protein